MSEMIGLGIPTHNGMWGGKVGYATYLNTFGINKNGLLVLPRLNAEGDVYVSPKTGAISTTVIRPHDPRSAVQMRRNLGRIWGDAIRQEYSTGGKTLKCGEWISSSPSEGVIYLNTETGKNMVLNEHSHDIRIIGSVSDDSSCHIEGSMVAGDLRSNLSGMLLEVYIGDTIGFEAVRKASGLSTSASLEDLATHIGNTIVASGFYQADRGSVKNEQARGTYSIGVYGDETWTVAFLTWGDKPVIHVCLKMPSEAPYFLTPELTRLLWDPFRCVIQAEGKE